MDREIYFRRKAKVDENALEVDSRYCVVSKAGGGDKGCVTIQSDGRYTVVIPEGAEKTKFVAQASTVKDKDVIVEIGMDPASGKAVLRAVYYPANKYDIEKVKKLASVVLDKYRGGSEIVDEVVDKIFTDETEFIKELKEALGEVDRKDVIPEVEKGVQEGADVDVDLAERGKDDVSEVGDMKHTGIKDVRDISGMSMHEFMRGRRDTRKTPVNLFDKLLDNLADMIDSFLDTD